MLSKLLSKHGIALMAFYVILFINYIIFLPIIIYHLRQFWRFRRSEVIKKRRPGLVVLIVVFLIIYILIFRSWTTYGDVLYPSLDKLSDRPSYHHYTFSIFLSYFLYFIALLILIRSWFVYYDWQRNAQLLSLQWKKLLKYNSSIIQRNNPWTLTCRPYLGNMQFLISCAIFLFFITELIVIVTSWNYDPITYIIVQIIMNVFVGVSAIFLFHQSLKLKDCIGIRAEIGVIVTLFVILTICYIPIIVFFPELSYERTLLVYSLYSIISFIAILRMIKIRWLLHNVAFGSRTLRKMRNSIHSIQSSFTGVGIGRKNSISGESSPPSTPLPPILFVNLSSNTNNNNNNNNNSGSGLNGRGRAGSCESNTSSIGHHLKMNNYNNNKLQIMTNDELPKLYSVLSDKIGFELFAAHLIKELAVENILFLIELFELKEALIENGYLTNIDIAIKWKVDIINEFILPLTAIDSTMNNENMTQKFIDFQCYLYNQYIATNSNYTINVKSRTRAKIANWINTNYDVLYEKNNNKEIEFIEEEKEKEKNIMNDNNDNNNVQKQKHKLILELFLLLHDKCGQEVYLLLSLDSYYRFSQTTQFKAWHELTNGVVIDDEDD